MSKDILYTKALNFSFSKSKIFDNLNLTLKQSEHIGIIGKNGIGKSTLLKALCGFYPELKTQIYLYDKKLAEYTEEQRSRLIAYIPQMVHFTFDLKLHEYFQIYSNNFSFQNKDLQYILEVFELTAYLETSVNHLSGGTLRKVLIAAAYLQGSKILLLDEPAAFLDPLQTIQIKKTLLDLAQLTGITYLIVSHDLDFLSNLTIENYYLKHAKLEPILSLSNAKLNLSAIYE